MVQQGLDEEFAVLEIFLEEDEGLVAAGEVEMVDVILFEGGLEGGLALFEIAKEGTQLINGRGWVDRVKEVRSVRYLHVADHHFTFSYGCRLTLLVAEVDVVGFQVD